MEAELETIRQAHYDASDALHDKQGSLAEAALEVSRLEERIRYVVDGRQRAQQRLADLQAQNTQWAERRAAAEAELEDIAEQIAAAEEQAELQAAQAEEQSAQLPTVEDAVRAAQNRANEQRGTVTQVQQQIQVLAAESRNLDEQSRQLRTRRERLAGERQALVVPEQARLEGLQQQSQAADEAFAVADGRLQTLQEQVPQLDEQRRAAAATVSREGGRLADLSARLEACARCRTRCRPKASSSPGWPNTAWRAWPACGPASTSKPAGKRRWKARCANG